VLNQSMLVRTNHKTATGESLMGDVFLAWRRRVDDLIADAPFIRFALFIFLIESRIFHFVSRHQK